MMMTSQQVLSVYEEMVVLTEQMVGAASASDWERLAVLEQRCAAHVKTLKENEPAAVLKGPSRLKKIEFLKKLLADDRKIRDLTMPWMAHLSALINSSGVERRLATAYGAV